MRVYPTATLLLPLLVFALLTGFGIWGVIAGANTYVEQHKNDVRSRAVDAATGFQVRISCSMRMGIGSSVVWAKRGSRKQRIACIAGLDKLGTRLPY